MGLRKVDLEQTEEASDLELRGKLDALDRSQAIIEFNLDGTILTANPNFLNAMGYRLEEIQGKHHRIFCESEYAQSQDYKSFWDRLNRGLFETAEYKRLGKGGKEIWIQASYNPIFDSNGRPFKVVKFATDITEQKIKNADYAGQIQAIDKSQAVIEFDLDGNILTANKNFLDTMGYRIDELKGKHHRMFAEPDYASSSAYKEFWAKLRRGEFDSGKYKRLGKGGKEIWIQASYNPIFDLNGKPYKVVKFATDLTQERMNYNNLVNSFDEATVKLSAASEELSATASQLAQNADVASSQSASAASSAAEVSTGVTSVATNTEEMMSSIKEISKSSTEASTMSKDALGQSKSANKTINQLGLASQEIGNVIKTISSIAQQTNLLALNATIEAARAGESGKGFAVVANEVKELAKQTAKATEDITNKISAVQGSTKEAVISIEQVTSAVEKLDAIANATAAAVEEQTATTNEVSRLISQSGEGVNNITQVIQEVAKGAEGNATNAQQTLSASRELAKMATSLKELVVNARKQN